MIVISVHSSVALKTVGWSITQIQYPHIWGVDSLSVDSKFTPRHDAVANSFAWRIARRLQDDGLQAVLMTTPLYSDTGSIDWIIGRLIEEHIIEFEVETAAPYANSFSNAHSNYGDFRGEWETGWIIKGYSHQKLSTVEKKSLSDFNKKEYERLSDEKVSSHEANPEEN